MKNLKGKLWQKQNIIIYKGTVIDEKIINENFWNFVRVFLSIIFLVAIAEIGAVINIINNTMPTIITSKKYRKENIKKFSGLPPVATPPRSHNAKYISQTSTEYANWKSVHTHCKIK